MEEVENKVVIDSPEEIDRKYKAKKRIRGLLIGINVVLIGYLVFDIGSLIFEKVSLNTHDDSYISLYNTSKRDSEKMYDTYLLKDEKGDYIVTELYDYGIYGDYLHLSKNRITPSNYSSVELTYSRRVKDFYEKLDVAYDSKSNFVFNKSYLDGGFRLSSLEEGEYFLFDEHIMETNFSDKHRAFKIRSEEMIYKTIYTLPDEVGTRKRIDLKSIDSSPCLVISVNEVDDIENNYYDFVFVGDNAEAYIKNIDKKYKVKYAETLLDAYLANSSYCFYIDEMATSITGSAYLKNEAVTKGEIYGGTSIIANQDKHDFIRELGGHLTNAGTCISEEDTSYVVAPYQSKNDIGKYTLTYSSAIEFNSILDIIK